MSGGEYVNPTGEGYLATYASGTSAAISGAVIKAVGWYGGQQLAVLADPPKLRIIPVEKLADPDEALSTVTVSSGRGGVSIAGYLLDEIGAGGENGPIRVYDRGGDGVTVVAADSDPFVEEADQ